MKKTILSLVALLGLSACSGLLPSLVGEPPALLQITAPQSIASTEPLSRKQLLIDVPVASAGIDTPRVAIIQGDGTMAYYKNVSWTDRVPVMYQTLLVESFGVSGKLPAVGRENVGLRADYLLKTDLLAFEASYKAGAVPVVKVSLTAKLIGMPRRLIVAGNTFSAEVEAENDSVLAVRDAFQQASDKAVSQLVNWTLNELDEQQQRRR